MSNVGSLLPIIRGEMSKLRIPHGSDKVYKDECMFSFDSPFSDTGLYVNMITFQGYGKDYLNHDIKSSGCKLYLHEIWKQVEKKVEKEHEAPPTKLAIGVSGGFMTESSFDVIKENFLVVVNGEVLESIQLPCPELPEFVSNVAQAIIEHDGMKLNMQVSTWDADSEKRLVSRYAHDLEQVNPDGKRIPQDPKQWKDEATGATENLWLNLSTGYIGGGRQNWDGTGGSGSALQHYEATGRKYPLAVKLGTITPHGAEVWSYAADEDNLVIDPKLGEHLSFWGIDIMRLEKTDKTLGEMEVALNMSYDWSRIMEDQEQLVPVSGPGFVGLQNLGSSCYLNSVMQSIMSIPEIQERYMLPHENIIATSAADPSTDFTVQMSKLAQGVLSSRYVPPTTTTGTGTSAETTGPASEESGKMNNLEKYIVAPRMFKHLVGKGHPEFSSGRQQDATEFFQYFLDIMSKSERVNLSRISLPGAVQACPTANIFEYHMEERYQCITSREVKYSKYGPGSLFNTLDLPIPLDRAIPVPSSASTSTYTGGMNQFKRPRVETKEGEGDWEMVHQQDTNGSTTEKNALAETDQFVPFSACLDTFFKPEQMDIFSPAVGSLAPCLKTQRFRTFPRYLMVKMSRYYAGANWVQMKITARVDVPEELDLTSYRAIGPQIDEKLMSEDIVEPTATASGTSTSAGVEPDQGLVAQLVSMGFSENGCRRAAIATHNADAETAMNWIFEHMEDPDFNDPPAPQNTPGPVAAGSKEGVSVDPEAMMMLTSMGYTETQVGAALQATDNNIERAADWLFSHADDLDSAVAQVRTFVRIFDYIVLGMKTLLSTLLYNNFGVQILSGTAGTGSTGCSTGTPEGCDDGEGKYTLKAVISHIGKSTDHGHYVCHVKIDGNWVLFNDEKVGQCTKAPLEHGFMYLYRRNDGPGTFAV